MEEFMDLQRFCCKDPLRAEAMGRPFTQEKTTWATNGWVAIGVPAVDAVSANPNAPYVGKVTPKTSPMEWFDIPVAEVAECEFCGGKVNDFPCPECKGHGTVTLKNDFTQYDGVECGTCDGAGEPLYCPLCSGTGVNSNELITIGTAQFKANALWLIRDLPKIQISPTGETTVAWLRFEGGEGFLMPGKHTR
jgi:hypothetical protein